MGYCQGMGFLAGLFLTYMIEEDAFYTFYAVLTRGMGVPYIITHAQTHAPPESTPLPLHSPIPFPLRLLYLPSLAEIQKILHVFTGLCHMHIPVVYGHMESEGVSHTHHTTNTIHHASYTNTIHVQVHPTMFFTEWGMCMFTRGFGFDLVTRVWDIYMLEGGYKVVYRVGMAILKVCVWCMVYGIWCLLNAITIVSQLLLILCYIPMLTICSLRSRPY
ncbi:TBC domain-containing protein [archaeon]|nr:MAG: TBC domain-containing protein [archaeon]